MPGDGSAVVRHAVERIWNCGDLAQADSLFALTYVNHGGLIPDMVQGPEAIKVSVALYRTAFPQFYVTIDSLAEDKDMVELRWAAHTIDSGACHTADLTGLVRSHIVDGQIVESWMIWNREAVLQHLLRPAQ